MVSPVPTPRSKTVIFGNPLSNSQRRTTVSTGYPVFYHPHPITSTTVTAVSSDSSSFFCRLFAAASAALLLVCVLALLLIVILHPRLPSLRVDSSELDSSTNSTRLTLTLLFVNPNRKLALYYSNLDVFLRYGTRNDVSSVRLPPFSQATSEETRVAAKLLLGEGIGGGDAEKGKNGTVDFGVKVFASVRFSAGMLRSRDQSLKAVCYPVTVVFDRSGDGNNGTTGTMVGPSDWCSV